MTFALDLDGVVWLEGEALPGAAGAVADLQAAGPVLFVTNASWFTVAQQEARLAACGIDAAGAVVTSATAAARLVPSGAEVLVVGGPGVHEAVVDAGGVPVDRAAAEADPSRVAVVVVGLDPSFGYDDLERASRAVHAGARLVGTNGDPSFPSPEGLRPGGGALLAAIATASGVEPVVAGKPHPPMVDLVRDRLGPGPGAVLGDRPSTDGALAASLGWTFVQVRSSVGPEGAAMTIPDLVVDDLAAAARHLVG